MPKIKFILDTQIGPELQTHIKPGLDENPKSSKYFVPKEYKQHPTLFSDDMRMATVKKCMPFLDAMTSGYIIPFYQDSILTFTKKYRGPDHPPGDTVEMSGDIDVAAAVSSTSTLGQYKFHQPWQIPKNYQDKPRLGGKFGNKWFIKTPPGYSCLFIHPMNQPKTDYEVVSGVVDTDVYDLPILFPYLIKKQFATPKKLATTGTQIKFQKGNPMVQVIPFKRESWTSWSGIENDFQKSTQGFGIIIDMYKKTFWQKKKYD